MNDALDPKNTSKLLAIFEEGKQFTEALLKENERLRLHVVNLSNEKQALESELLSRDISSLKERICQLEQENAQALGSLKSLREQCTNVEKENWEFAERYVDIERKNTNLINLYVASYRLHSTLKYAEVIEIIKEIIINLIGSEDFRIYLNDTQENRLVLIAYEGPEPAQSTLNIKDDIVSNTVVSGTPYIASEAEAAAAKDGPMACIPMKVDDKIMGLIVIQRLLMQKNGFQKRDYELFELLAGHAATAIYGSHLYSLSERKRTTLEGFLEFLKKDLMNKKKQLEGDLR